MNECPWLSYSRNASSPSSFTKRTKGEKREKATGGKRASPWKITTKYSKPSVRGAPEFPDGVVVPRYRVDVLQLQSHVLEEHVFPLIDGPVLVALELALLKDAIKHKDGLAVLLPHGQPKVTYGRGEGT